MTDRDDILLRIHVNVTKTEEVRGAHAAARLLFFDGYCDGPLFHGTILPGGVDTQTQLPSGATLLSARYILDGVDHGGGPCRIFIENNMTLPPDGSNRLTVYTDSPRLSWLESAEIYSEMAWAEDFQILIRGTMPEK